MTQEPAELPTEERLIQLLRHLGIERAHFAACRAADYEGLASAYPETIASLTLVCPLRPRADLLHHLGTRSLLIDGDRGPGGDSARRAVARAPAATYVALKDYFGSGWADVVADRTDEVEAAMREFLEGRRVPSVSLKEGQSEVAGMTYETRGSGPPLVLVPLLLAPSQWDPLVPRLSERYCTIRLGGRWLGGAGLLEQRASEPGWFRMVRNVVEDTHLRPGETVLDVGCGSGALDRWLVRRTGGANAVTGVDVNRYLLREAAALAREDGLDGAIQFREGNAEALPFPDDSFDLAFSCTVLEELDADRALRELVRVTKAGGRVAVIVRAIDRRPWINLPLRPELLEKASPTTAGKDEDGCADASLYGRLRRAGLSAVVAAPQWAVQSPSPQRRSAFLAQFTGSFGKEELHEWETAVARAEAEGSFFVAQPLHCAVGTKP